MKKDELGKFLSDVDTIDDSIFGKNPPMEELEEKEFELLTIPSHVNSTQSDASFDYVSSRAILYSLINKAGTNLEMVTQLSKINTDPNGFKVANEIMGTMMNMIKLLNSNHKLHREVKSMGDISEESTSASKPDIKFKGSLLSLKGALESGDLESTLNSDDINSK